MPCTHWIFLGVERLYDKPIEVAKGIRATFIDAGHILGSACVFLELEEQGEKRLVLFSGDLGNYNRAILRDPAVPPHADVVVMETTYGDHSHKELEPSIEELFEAIENTTRRGGNVIIPTFALERAQEILYYLHEGWQQNVCPVVCRCFWILPWLFLPPLFLLVTLNAMTMKPKSCLLTDMTLSIFHPCILPMKRQIPWR